MNIYGLFVVSSNVTSQLKRCLPRKCYQVLRAAEVKAARERANVLHDTYIPYPVQN
jgi:hypothetical protein